MNIRWNWRKFLPIIAVISAIFFLVSGYAANQMAPVDSEVEPDGNGFSTAILLIIFVTIPAFCFLIVSVFAAVVDMMNRKRN